MKALACGIVGLALIACAAVHAGEVHKCVDADGKVTFSDTTCPDAAMQDEGSAGQAQPGGEPQPAQTPAQPAAQPASTPAQPSAQPPPRGGYGAYIDRGRAAQDASEANDGQ